MTTTTTGRAVDASAATALRASYDSLVKAGGDSVRAAWRFGQTCDSFTDAYQIIEIAELLGLSKGTIGRYLRFYRAYQRPELAIYASEQLQTYNIDILVEMQDDLRPIEHARPLAGRRYRYRCQHCKSTEVAREEIDPDDLDTDDTAKENR
jgi:hypothetical protein